MWACGAEPSTEGEYLMCRNPECPATQIGRMKTWVKQLGLLEWGEKTFIRFWKEGLIKEVADLYVLKVEDISPLEGYGEASAEKLLVPLKENKKIPMATYIAALGIESVSKETGKLLVAAGYNDFKAIAQTSVDELALIEGLGSIKAEKNHQRNESSAR